MVSQLFTSNYVFGIDQNFKKKNKERNKIFLLKKLQKGAMC